MFGNAFDQSLKGREVEKELLQCKKQLELERNRSMKLQRKIHKLKEHKVSQSPSPIRIRNIRRTSCADRLLLVLSLDAG